MRSIRDRVTAVVAAGALLAIWLPAVITVLIVVPESLRVGSFRIAMVVATVLLTVVAWAIGRIAARFAVLPLTEATSRLEVIAAGHLERSTPVNSAREIKRLETAIEQIVRRNWEREQRHATAVGALAHDVRSSLAAMANALDPKLDTSGAAQGGGTTAEIARALLEEVRRMQRISGDLVAFMRAGSETVRSETVDVADVAVEVARAVAFGTGIDVDVVVTRSNVRSAPAGLIERILRNVIENAARAARTSVKIEVLAGLVIVSDDGEGFPSAMVLATDGMGRFVAPVASGIDHGAGFEIASRLAEASGGRVVIERSTRQGSTVLVYV